MSKDLKKGMLGVLILLIGVIVGVLLVEQTQNFKNKAKEQSQQTYTVCHKTGDPKNQWEEVSVSADKLPDYLNAGDIFGNCP